MEQQAQIFRNAEVVFGPHGAGFSNIVFCKEKTKIIEIYQDYTASCFWFLSEFLNLEHYAHKCISIDESEFLSSANFSSIQERDRLSGFHVDINEISKVLEFAGISKIV